MKIDKSKSVHLMGIGGIGMSGLAYILRDLGIRVSGCDRYINETCKELSMKGVEIFLGHGTYHLSGEDILVCSSAIRKDEPEFVSAEKHGIPAYRRTEFLKELITGREQICVTGTHGKTTTTGMIKCILELSEQEIGYLIGGHLLDTRRNGKWGKDQLFLLETDESDGTHILFTPYIGVITNIEFDHTDFYKDIDMIERFMQEFAWKILPEGYLIGCGEDERVRRMKSSGEKILYGFSEGNQVIAKEVSINERGTRFKVYIDNVFWGNVELKVLGIHNVLNALAGISVGVVLEIKKEVIITGLESFKGIKRRMEVLVDDKIKIIDDYAHHPTEIQKVINAVKEIAKGRIIVVFQPHRYTRVKALWNEFGRCFNGIDQLILLDIYPAGEEPIEGVNGRLIEKAVRMCGMEKITFIQKEDTISFLFRIIEENDTILFLGAGDITNLSYEMAKRWIEDEWKGVGKEEEIEMNLPIFI